MRTRHVIAVIRLGAISLLGSFCTTSQAAPASTTDLTDFITRMGGWFYETDADNNSPAKIVDPWAKYWVQVSYTASSNATPSYVTTIKMTRYNQQREDTKGVCSTDNVVTDMVVLDLRELQPTAPITADKVDKKWPVWSVKLMMNGGKPLIRVVTTVTPPTIVGFSAGSSAPASSAPASSGPGTGTAATCPALRNGQQLIATTQQSDQNFYSIQFAGQDQAKYFQMLIATAVPGLAPPRAKNGTPTP